MFQYPLLIPGELSETLSKKYEKMFKKQNHETVEEIPPMI